MANRMIKLFQTTHLQQPLRDVADACREFALKMDRELPEGPEKTTGLRKLLEAKDCFVRTKIENDAG